MLGLFLEGNTLLVKGDATYKQLPYFISEIKKYRNVECIDLRQVENLDTLFFTYLIDLNKNLKLTDSQEKLKEIILSHVSLDKFSSKNSKVKILEDIGISTVNSAKELYSFLAFIGEVFVKFITILFNPRRIRFKSIVCDVEIMGLKAVPILSTISFLIGAVIAYHGSIRLKQFGANIFVVDLVSISVLRELGPLLVAILMAGRSASSYTAQIGIMKVTEEIDVIKTMGIDPFDILIFPKIMSMLIVFPLLIILSDIVGVFGGAVVAKLALNVTFSDFMLRLHQAIDIKTFLSGLLKAPAFAFLIASIGSFKGFETKKNVESIGKSVTISVVDSLFAVIIADAVFSVLFRWVGM